MLAGLAFKRRWQNKMRAAGKPCDKPNIVTGANVQVSTNIFITQCVVVLNHTLPKLC
jgi:glutamate/tyrosine decarboxylase-like PLP-dependent enzyme